MPWTTPTLEETRAQNRDFITARLQSGAMVPNSVLRVLADSNAGLAFLALLYIDWLSKQFLPDTAETEWLDRHANIWLGGRKAASFSSGSVTLTGIAGTVVPAATQIAGQSASGQIRFETKEEITLDSGPTPVEVEAIDAGAAGNFDPGTSLSLLDAISGVEGAAIVVELLGGADAESDDDLRARVLERIQQPPQGGAAHDYVAWAKEIPGVTRAWTSPGEMGIGTVTVRFMMDDLRASNAGFPLAEDVALVQNYLETKRPVTARDMFVEAPLPEPVGFAISNLDDDRPSTRAAIEVSVREMLRARAAPAYARNGLAQPAQTIYREWVSEAIFHAAGVRSFDLTMSDYVMPSPGHMGVLGSITYG